MNSKLYKLSEKLKDATQGAIDLQLIPHPSYPDYLLFYDSQYLGAKKEEVAHRMIGTGIIVNFVIGFILASALILSADLLLNLVNTESVLFDNSKTYLSVIAISLFLIAPTEEIMACLQLK